MGHLGRPQTPPAPNIHDAVPEEPTIDPEAISNLRELNPGDNGEFLREIVGIYIEDTPKRVAELRKFLAAGDLAAFTRAAHTIKGSSANVGAARVRALAERLEQLGRRDGLSGVGSLVDQCDQAFAEAAAALRSLSA